MGAVPSESHLLSHGVAPLIERFHHGPRDSSQVGPIYVERERLIRALRHLCDEVFVEFLDPGQQWVPELCRYRGGGALDRIRRQIRVP